MLAAHLMLLVGLPLAGQTLPPVWTVQDTQDLTEVTGPVTTAVSPNGEVFIAGSFNWYDWPAATNTIGDVSKFPLFISKLDSSGNPLYATLIGGVARQDLMLDSVGNLYVHGVAGANEFGTTPGAYRSTHISSNGNDFVCKLRASDGAILLCALFDTDSMANFSVDSAGSIYFAGIPSTLVDATPGAYTFGNRRIAITKVDAAGSTVLWRAELSDTGRGNAPSSLAVDPQGNLWIAGTAYSRDIPTTPDAMVSVFPTASGSISPTTGYLVKLNPSGTSLLYATYTGPVETLQSMSLDSSGNIYTLTFSNSVPLVRKFNSDGKALVYEHALPGINEFGVDLEVDELGFVTVIGSTQNVNFATYRSAQNCSLTEIPAGSNDGVLVRIGPGGELLESTFLGLKRPVSVSVQPWKFFAEAAKAYVIVWWDLNQGASIYDSLIGPHQMELLRLEPDANAGDGLKFSCVGSAATLAGAPLVRGEIISLFGTGLGPKSPAAGQPGMDNRFPTALGGTQVTFDGVAAPLLYASDTQINAIVPWDLSGLSGTKVCVSFQTVKTNCILAGWTFAAPGIFQQASGFAAVVNQDGTINSPDHPARAGSTVYIYATGLGPVSPLPADGSIAPLPAPTSTSPVEAVFIRGLAELHGEVSHAGLAPLEVAGLFQIDVKIPAFSAAFPETVQQWNLSVVVDLPGNFGVASPSLPISLAP